MNFLDIFHLDHELKICHFAKIKVQHFDVIVELMEKRCFFNFRKEFFFSDLISEFAKLHIDSSDLLFDHVDKFAKILFFLQPFSKLSFIGHDFD